MLHCVSRLGVLSYLYEKRNDIAYAAGLISHVPITLCTEKHDVLKDLLKLNSDQERGEVPAKFPIAQDITLFPPTVPDYNQSAGLQGVEKKTKLYYQEDLSNYFQDIFHPPPLG